MCIRDSLGTQAAGINDALVAIERLAHQRDARLDLRRQLRLAVRLVRHEPGIVHSELITWAHEHTIAVLA